MNKEEKYSTLRVVIFGGHKQKDKKAVEIKDRREKTERQKPPSPIALPPSPSQRQSIQMRTGGSKSDQGMSPRF